MIRSIWTLLAGGVIATVHRDGALYERGPNSTLDTSQRIAELLTELGIAGERADAAQSAAIRFIASRIAVR